MPLGKHIRFFGDSFQKSKLIAGKRYWRVPVMDGEFLVQEVKIGKLDVPHALIPRILNQMKRGRVVPGVSQNGLPMVMPSYISDVRIANGKITLYKSVR